MQVWQQPEPQEKSTAFSDGKVTVWFPPVPSGLAGTDPETLMSEVLLVMPRMVTNWSVACVVDP